MAPIDNMDINESLLADCEDSDGGATLTEFASPYGGLQQRRLAGNSGPQLKTVRRRLQQRQLEQQQQQQPPRPSTLKPCLRQIPAVLNNGSSTTGTGAQKPQKAVTFNDTVVKTEYWVHAIISKSDREDAVFHGTHRGFPSLKWQLKQEKHMAEREQYKSRLVKEGEICLCVDQRCTPGANQEAAPAELMSPETGAWWNSLERLFQLAICNINNEAAMRVEALSAPLLSDGVVARGRLCDRVEKIRFSYEQKVTELLQCAGALPPYHPPKRKTPAVVDAEEESDWAEVHAKAKARLRSCRKVKHKKQADTELEQMRLELDKVL